MREHDIIRRYFRYDRGAGVVLGVGDDAAVLAPPDGQLVVSSDSLNAGVHFFAECDPYLLARKAAAVSLSDIAAMGGEALWLTVALSAPAATGSDWFARFAGGLKSSAEEYSYAVVGGDLTRGDSLSVTTTALGVCRQPPRTRSAAQAGDAVWLSGCVGIAAHALQARLGQLARADDMNAAEARLDDPAPRLRLGQALAEYAHAMMDISDGLLASAQAIAEQSAVKIRIDAARLPSVPSLAVLSDEQRRQCQFNGGDDYELLFTAPAAAAVAIKKQATAQTALTCIGEVVGGGGVDIHHRGAVLDIACAGYQHQFV